MNSAQNGFSYTGTIDIKEDKTDADSISATAQPSIAIVGSVTEKNNALSSVSWIN